MSARNHSPRSEIQPPQSPAPTRPARRLLLKEARLAGDLLRMTATLDHQLTEPQKQLPEARHIMVIPGFGSNDRHTAGLRYQLQREGYTVSGWGLGTNRAGAGIDKALENLSDRWDLDRKREHRGEAEVPALCDQVTDVVKAKSIALQQPITLIGWSLGGYVAREVARDLPKEVNRVITLGSPCIGGPKYSAAAPLFMRRGLDLDWIEAEVLKRFARPIQQPITAIYSESDAIVSWTAAIDHYSPNVRHVRVDAAHLGMGFNPEIWQLISHSLSLPPDEA